MTSKAEMTVRLDLDEMARFQAAREFCQGGQATYLDGAFAKLLMLAAIDEIEGVMAERAEQEAMPRAASEGY